MTENVLMEDKVLKNEWLPVLLSSDLHDDPISIKLLGEQLVVFRTKDKVHAFKDLCIHRGAPLSLGRVVDDRLICAYHGWEYNSCGDCVRIPAQEPDQPISKKARAIVYLCKEQYGLIWVCKGEPARPIPERMQREDPNFKSLLYGPYKVKAAAPRMIENFLDVSHLMFLHDGILGDSKFPVISNYTVNWQGNKLVSDEIGIYKPDIDGGEGVTHYYTYEILGPLVARFVNKDPVSNKVIDMLMLVQPEDEKNSTAFMIGSFNYQHLATDEERIERQNEIFYQDLEILERQKPELLPLDLQEELHLKSDRVSIAYRKWLRELHLTFGTD